MTSWDEGWHCALCSHFNWSCYKACQRCSAKEVVRHPSTYTTSVQGPAFVGRTATTSSPSWLHWPRAELPHPGRCCTAGASCWSDTLERSAVHSQCTACEDSQPGSCPSWIPDRWRLLQDPPRRAQQTDHEFQTADHRLQADRVGSDQSVRFLRFVEGAGSVGSVTFVKIGVRTHWICWVRWFCRVCLPSVVIRYIYGFLVTYIQHVTQTIS